MVIHWRDKMSVDGGVIDNDHKHLVEIINRFEKFAADGLSRDEGMEILYALKFYTSTHFKREEGMQLRANYPHYEDHKREHEALLAKLDAIIAELQAGPDKALDEVAKHTAALLQHWLMDHVLNSDLKMKPFVAAMREDADALEDLGAIDPQA